VSYLDAHIARMKLHEDIGKPLYQQYLKYFDLSQSNQALGSASRIAEMMPTEVRAEHIRAALKQGETFTMSLPMYQLVRATSGDMPDEPLMPEDLPSLQGFLYLPEPFEEIDLHGRILRSHVITWGVMEHVRRRNGSSGYGLVLNWFTNRHDSMDEVNQELARSAGWQDIGKYVLMATNIVYFGETLPRSPDPSPVREIAPLMHTPEWRHQYLVHEEEFLDTTPEGEFTRAIRYVPVRNADSTLTEEEWGIIVAAYEQIHQRPLLDDYSIKRLVCFWRLCQQTLAARDYVRPNRGLAKMMVRRRFKTTPVTVITLRRRKHPENGSHQVEWDHRWLRRGHWRQQWYGSADTRHQRAIYINPTICGPEDKPLLIRPHVNVLSR
jgi:hypothetical protein